MKSKKIVLHITISVKEVIRIFTLISDDEESEISPSERQQSESAKRKSKVPEFAIRSSKS